MNASEKSLGKRLKKLGYFSYKSYLQSEHWKNLKKDFFSRSGRIKEMYAKKGFLYCEFCGNANFLAVHHRTYKRLGHEKIRDLRLICRNCHRTIHILPRDSKNNLWERTKKIMWQNKAA